MQPTTERDPLDILLNFSREEAFVCYQKLNDKTHGQIAGLMDIKGNGVKVVQNYSSEVFRKAGVEGKDLDTLRNKIGTLLIYVVNSDDWSPTWDIDRKKLAELKIKNSSLEGKATQPATSTSLPEDHQPPSPEPVKASSTPTESRRPTENQPSFIRRLAGNRVAQIIGAIIVIFGCCSLITLSIFFRPFRNIFLPRQTSTPSLTRTFTLPPTETLIPTLIPSSTFTSSRTSTPTATSTATNTATETFTPTITDTLAPSNTPTDTITPSPTPVVLFYDNFENGKSDQWNVISGEPLVSNGILSTNGTLWMEVGDPSWTDLKIEINISLSYNSSCGDKPFPQGYRVAMIGLRFQDIENMIALKLSSCGLEWFIVKNNQYEWLPQGGAPGPGYWNFQTITAIIQGNKFTAYVNGLGSTTFFNDLYPTGKIGLRLDPDTQVKSIKIEKLP